MLCLLRPGAIQTMHIPTVPCLRCAPYAYGVSFTPLFTAGLPPSAKPLGLLFCPPHLTAPPVFPSSSSASKIHAPTIRRLKVVTISTC